ncbi:MAG: hypothetical protein OEM51_00610 [Gammaproteobacteria bacterium]|nr:hypothetical protein [Gammaproteobacteria bacterium]MDH3430352.1 hypothetical protein [Gammaproteobacteria bacterium]
MDTAWIQVFVLTLAECVAPAGKTVCQEREFDLQFLTRADCELALEQLVTLKTESEHVIVNKSKSSCAPSARETNIFASVDAVSAAADDSRGWRDPAVKVAASAQSASHQDRLEKLPACEDTDGEAPCKMGGIIIEAATDGKSVEVWRRDP